MKKQYLSYINEQFSSSIEDLTPQVKVIYMAIYTAITSRRLQPGTRLSEPVLSTTFDCSRGTVRLAIQALARDKIVTLIPYKGAKVSAPTPEEAKDLFKARKLLEEAIAKQLVGLNRDRQLIKALKANIATEEKVASEESTALSYKHQQQISHIFHLILAKALNNTVISTIMIDLLARSSLVTDIYEKPNSACCTHMSHEKLVDLLINKPQEFPVAMMEHLDEIYLNLDFCEQGSQDKDIVNILKGH
ncbi:hypothetical protein HA49_14600 [Tatumella morbirosei]|uniref:HTH gntR-type domain-containing protein n=1 Tax=Tatumella morbirosei TaxID=642227 RepID=A0A095UC67_9GAMM|nr:GntR family transcriptional regulator [Tatumella morbirosei]KGD72023.1 hypothetical protein HA49_14600 [Tatumella morbirosei]